MNDPAGSRSRYSRMHAGRQASRVVLCATLLLMVAPSIAAAGKTPTHCRDVVFDGAAGAASNDKVTLRVVDKDGAVLDESCPIQVKPLETAIEFGTRLPGAWGPGTGNVVACANPQPTPTPPAKPLNKTCGVGLLGHSCKHQWYFKQKPDSTITKKYLRICCYEGSECKGKKFGKELTIGRTPISLQTKIDPALVFAPEVPPEAGITLTPVALDPIGLTQQPPRDLQSCRASLGKTLVRAAATVLKALVECHGQTMLGGPVGNCNSLNDPTVAATLAKVEEAVLAAVLKKCELFGSPSTYGYGICPSPCDGIAVNTCTAGLVGNTCTNDPSCDTAPGARDGRCGDWNQAAQCLSCLAKEAVRDTVVDKYGDPGPGPGLPPGQLGCQQAIGDGLLYLAATLLKDQADCQKKKDSGAVVLPEGPGGSAGSCKDADLKGKRQDTEFKTRATIVASCSDFDVAALDVCEPKATTAVEAAECVVANARALAAAMSDAAFPEGRIAVPPPTSCPATVEFEGVSGPAAYDLGGTGLGHDASVVSDGKLSLAVTACENPNPPCGTCNFTGPIDNAGADAGDIHNRRCTGNTRYKCASNADCAAAGGTCEFYFGSYQPLAAGGVSFCVGNQVNGPISGTVDLDSGAGGYNADLKWQVYVGPSPANPCPRCLGDAARNDGMRHGICDSGANTGLACDVNGSSPNVHFGQTSFDCPPLGGAAIATLPVKYANTTGDTSKQLSTASPNCRAPGFTGLKCFCDTCNNANAEPCETSADCPDPPGPVGPICGGKRCLGGPNDGSPCLSTTECPIGTCGVPGWSTRPNACDDDLCSPNGADTDGPNEGQCAGGPFETFCGPTATFQGCVTHADCAAFSGDTCSFGKFRECFTDNGLLGAVVHATGVANGSNPTVAALFCLGPTASPAVNYVWGLPGLGRLELPGQVSAAP